MDDRASVSVAIASWNSADCLRGCLEALFAQSLLPEEVVVVDNGSTDGSADLVSTDYPVAKVIRRPVNEGFCAGYNRAIGATVHPYVLILNTDVFLDRDFLLRAVEVAGEDDRIGWVAANIRRADGRGVDYVGQFLRRRLSLVNSRIETGREDVFAGSGSAVFCRRAMLDDIAYEGEIYDEAFFAYLEDLDLAWRAQLRGWRCVFDASLTARHLGSASMGGRIRVMDKPAFFQRHIIKNRLLTVINNATPGVLASLLPWFVLAELGFALSLLVKSPRRLRLVGDAYRTAFRMLPRAMRKRRFIQSRRLVSDAHIRSMLRGV